MGNQLKEAPSDKYAKERGRPTAGRCSGVSLRFDGDYLTLTHSRGSSRWRAYSGKPVNGNFDYSTARQRIPDAGPIPEGRYWVDISEMDDNWWNSFVPQIRAAWGRFRLSIHPYPDTITYGRGGFFIHGGSEAGSAGCIDLVRSIEMFVIELNQLGLYDGWSGGKACHIPLVVAYPILGDFPDPATDRAYA